MPDRIWIGRETTSAQRPWKPDKLGALPPRRLLTQLLVLFVALEHVGFLVLEMFFWTAPGTIQSFGLTPELAQGSATLAANQGLYNGFLAAGLVWGLASGERSREVLTFFLSCILVAGIFGGFTAKASILVLQAAPAGLALALVRSGGPGRTDSTDSPGKE